MTNLCASDQIMFSTVRIKNYTKNGEESAGTGFFYNYKDTLFLVTNKHVVENAEKIEFMTVTRDENANVDYHSMAVFSLDEDYLQNKSFGHPSADVDIQVINLNNAPFKCERLNRAPFFTMISDKIVPDKTTLEELFAIEDVVFVGYPNSMWDEVNHLPIVRTGTTASLLTMDFNGQPKFLIDASVFPGSSGSPVFTLNETSYGNRQGGFVVGSRVLFLGVISSVYLRNDMADIEIIPVPTTNKPVALVKQMIDLGVVEKAITVVETVKLCYEKVTSSKKLF